MQICSFFVLNQFPVTIASLNKDSPSFDKAFLISTFPRPRYLSFLYLSFRHVKTLYFWCYLYGCKKCKYKYVACFFKELCLLLNSILEIIPFVILYIFYRKLPNPNLSNTLSKCHGEMRPGCFPAL